MGRALDLAKWHVDLSTVGMFLATLALASTHVTQTYYEMVLKFKTIL